VQANRKPISVEFDIYLPNKNFKKSSPGVPVYRVVLMNHHGDNQVPGLHDIIEARQKTHCNKITSLLYAYVDNGNVLFYNFLPLDA
jgi:hypothetical protein